MTCTVGMKASIAKKKKKIRPRMMHFDKILTDLWNKKEGTENWAKFIRESFAFLIVFIIESSKHKWLNHDRLAD